MNVIKIRFIHLYLKTHVRTRIIYIYTSYVNKKIMYNYITVYYIEFAADPDDHNTHYKLVYIKTNGTQLSENIC